MLGGKDTVVYRGRAVAGWLWWGTWAALLAMALVPPVLEDDFVSIGDFLIQVFAYGVAWGVPIWVMLLTLWSMEFYGRLTLTRSTLRVGRDRMPLSELDPVGARAVDREQPAMGARLRTSAGDVHVPRSARARPHGATFRYLGGSYGTPWGMDAVSLPTRDGGAVRFYVRNRGAFLAALDGVLPSS